MGDVRKGTPGIYLIYNSKSDKVYVGQTVCLSSRRSNHFGHLRRGTHDNPHLQRAYNRDGPGAFSFHVALRAEYLQTLGLSLLEAEQMVYDSFDKDSTYNVGDLLASPFLGKKHRPETIALLSRPRNRPLTDDHKQRISESLKNRVFTQQHKERLSEAGRGVPKTEDAKVKVARTKSQDLLVIYETGDVFESTLELSHALGLTTQYVSDGVRNGRRVMNLTILRVPKDGARAACVLPDPTVGLEPRLGSSTGRPQWRVRRTSRQSDPRQGSLDQRQNLRQALTGAEAGLCWVDEE